MVVTADGDHEISRIVAYVKLLIGFDDHACHTGLG